MSRWLRERAMEARRTLAVDRVGRWRVESEDGEGRGGRG